MFELLNERIAIQNKVIEKLQSLIKGISVRLTTQGLPNIPIRDCLECYSSTLQESEVHETGQCVVYGAAGQIGYIDSAMVSGEAMMIIKDGSGVGTVSYAQGNFSVIGTLNYLTAKNGFHLPYLYFALKAFNFQPYKTGMAIPHIYFKDYGRAKIWCPEMVQQKRIADTIRAVERKAICEMEILGCLLNLKAYLLRQMFI